MSCPKCDEAQALVEKVEAACWQSQERLIKERDEARGLARDYVLGCCGDTRRRELEEEYPWLKRP